MADWKEQYLQLWNKMEKRQRYAIIGIAVVVFLAILGGSYFYGQKPDEVPLFTNMETKDAGEVAAKLKEAKVPYTVKENDQGTTIFVPAKEVYNARMDLATQGLPRGQKGFEIFDDSKLGVTEFQNRVNYLQALQGELTRTIEQIGAVAKARIHIVLPEDSLYKKNEKPATASIMIKLKPNMELSKKEIKGIVNLTAHSIQGLVPENITIVDDSGKILNDPDEEENLGSKTLHQLDMTKKVENRLETNVQSLLDQALGQGKAYVRVSVELDFDQRQVDRQTFTPVVDEAGIIRSQQDTSESYQGTSNEPGGPAGTQSNIPGYVATENNSNANYDKKESTKNYEINEEKQKVIASPGSIRRLTIAVLVNEEITKAQQESILRSVSSAAGINPDRGDTISVEALPFSTEVADRRAAEERAMKARADLEFYSYILIGLLLLAIPIVLYILYKKKKKREEEERIRREEEEAQIRAQQMEDELREQAITQGEIPEEELTEEEKTYLEQRSAIEEFIKERPDDVALLVKTWLSEE